MTSDEWNPFEQATFVIAIPTVEINDRQNRIHAAAGALHDWVHEYLVEHGANASVFEHKHLIAQMVATGMVVQFEFDEACASDLRDEIRDLT